MSATDTAAAPAASPTVQLLQKLHSVYRAVRFVEKRGRNDHHGYSYAQALDVVRDIRAALVRRKIIVIPGTVPGSVQHHTETGGRSFVTTVDMVYRFIDTETGAEITVPWTGAGADTGGDKGLYKAYTGGLKYALLSLFMLPMTDDPERDALSQGCEPEAAPESTVANDAERPAATRIPVDRAKAILQAATHAGMVNEDASFTAPFKAYLTAEQGVDKIGKLNVDQAEAVEAWIASEVAASVREGEGQS